MSGPTPVPLTEARGRLAEVESAEEFRKVLVELANAPLVEDPPDPAVLALRYGRRGR